MKMETIIRRNLPKLTKKRVTSSRCTRVRQDPFPKSFSTNWYEADTGEEGEDTIFQNRGKLYRFVNGNWMERGQGIFKLNVARADEEKFSGESESAGPRRARFIMRTHATHRVVLNSPIFKEMKVGNIQGDEPTGKKALTFSVPVDGRLELHLVRVRTSPGLANFCGTECLANHAAQMGKEDDIMKLWQEVKALQKAM